MKEADFEALLDLAAEQLGKEMRESNLYHPPLEFEKRVFEVLQQIAAGENIKIAPTFHPHAFPDIKANGFGVEVKTTNKDSWLSVANSIFEGMRDPSVKRIYVVFGKMGGMPSVKWGRYDDRITHVRISHAPRFVLEMDRDSSLFDKMGVTYDEFCKQTPDGKMEHVRKYSRKRLQAGERLWWLEDENSEGRELKVKLYMNLSPAEKSKLRAQGALLFPKIVSGSRVKDKYNDVALFFLTYHNVFCPQTRDLYTAGSVAGKERGGNYLQRALKKIQNEMLEAAQSLPSAVFEEYWGEQVAPADRIKLWLRKADRLAKDWKPSKELFQEAKEGE